MFRCRVGLCVLAIAFLVSVVPVSAQVVVDDTAPRYGSGPVTSVTGRWCPSDAPNPYAGGSLSSCGSGTDTFRWIPMLSADGTYDVYVWWTANAGRSPRVPIRVNHAGGATTREFDQRQTGGQWVYHGRYTFGAGAAGSVETSDVNGRASADAVQFVPVTVTLPTVTVAARDDTIAEAGRNPGRFTVSRSRGVGAPLTVYFTLGGTATVGSDYASPSESMSFPAGASAVDVYIWPLDDALAEGPETIVMTLASNAAYVVGSPSTATLTITSDEAPSDVVVDNGAAGTTSTGAWCASTAPNPYGDNALQSCGPGSDTYRWTPTLAATGTYDVYVWWTNDPGRSGAVPVTVNHSGSTTTRTFDQRSGGGQWHQHGRYAFAAGRTGWVETSDAGGPATADAVRFVLISNDLPVVTLRAYGGDYYTPPPGIAEAGPYSRGSFSFDRTGNTTQPLTVFYDIGGTARNGVDYARISGSVTIDAPYGTASVPIVAFADALNEGRETVTVTLRPNGAYRIGEPATLTITIGENGSTSLVVDDWSGSTTRTGSWCASPPSYARNPWNGGSVHSCGTGRDTFRWMVPFLPEPRIFDVYVWWTSTPARSARAPFTVSHAAGTTTRLFDQRTGGGQWHYHGTYAFDGGPEGWLETSDVNGQVSADAVMFAHPAPPAAFAWIPNRGSNTVSVVDLTTQQPVATIPVGRSPFGVVAGERVYVGNLDDGTVSVIDPDTRTVRRTIAVGGRPFGLTLDDPGARLYVSNGNTGRVSVIDTVTESVIATIPVGSAPRGVAIDPVRARVYVVTAVGRLVAIDRATNAVVGQRTVPGAQGVAIDPDGGRLWVTHPDADSVSVIDAATLDLIATIPVGDSPRAVAVSPSGNAVFVTSFGSDQVHVIDPAELRSFQIFQENGTRPEGVSVDPVARYVYVANTATGTITRIENYTWQPTFSAIRVGATPGAFGEFIAVPR